MVSAHLGSVVVCDVPTKEYLLFLNKGLRQSDKFIIKELDDTHLFVKQDKVSYVQQAVKDFNDSNVFTPPLREEEPKPFGKK